MNSHDVNKKFKLISRFIYFGMAILCLIIFLIIAMDYQSNSALKKLVEQNSNNSALYTNIIYLDEVLTMSANMAALTGEKKWTDRYNQFEPVLDSSIKKAITLYPQEYNKAGAKQIDDANQKLVAIEKHVLELAGQGKLAEAKNLMQSKEYAEQKQLYADGMKKFTLMILNNISDKLRETSVEMIERSLLFVSMIVLFGIAGILIRSTRSIIQYQHGIEIELRKHQQHLQSIVDEQTSSLLNAKEKAESANKAKSEFLLNTSHELRTPLHAILGFAKLGLKNIDRWSKEKNMDNLNDINESGERLLLFLNDLLDLSKLESGSIECNPVRDDLAALSYQTIKELSVLSDKKNLNIILEGCNPAWAEYDPVQIKQVMTNLLSNAIKFSPENKKITIRIEEKQVPEGRRKTDKGTVPGLMISVIDEGIGIPENELEDVFDKFIQSSKTRTGAGGTGLGLAICQQVISMHKGIIWAKNNPDGGAKLAFMIPTKNSVIKN